MKNHTKIYYENAGYDLSDFVECEVCKNPAVDIHHINARGMGGDPQGKKDVFSNLMALCRNCHETYGDISEQKEMLQRTHNLRFDI